MFPPSPSRILELAIFRFEEVCVAVQGDMGGYLRTAALEKQPGIEATFRWLRRRGIGICLLTDYGREDFLLLLDRLGWGIGEEETVQLVVLEQSRKENPIRLAYASAGLRFAQQAIVVVDTPRLLRCAQRAGSALSFGVTNGACSYQELAGEPYRALLDGTIQLPNHLLRTLPVERPGPANAPRAETTPPRLWFPAVG